MVLIRFEGAAQTVTGSMHLVEFNGKKLLLDCGLYQGPRKEAYERNRSFPFDGTKIDAVVLSHAHIDHCGNLPTLVKSGFRGKIFCTEATRDLASVLMLDSAEIQEGDVFYNNKLRRANHKTPFEPLYTVPDAQQAIRQLDSVDYAEKFEPIPGVICRFFDAGHMLGSASVEVIFNDGSGKKTHLLFSGDVGRKGVPILRDPFIISCANYVIMESTYGSRIHPTQADDRSTLEEAFHRTAENGGKLIIPAFAVGRTQEILYRLNELHELKSLPNIPVYVDSPMAAEALQVFKDHPECYDKEMLRKLQQEHDRDPLGFRALRVVRSGEESKKLNDTRGPCVIISASGMCEAGRVVHHLKHNISDPNTTILFSGYQAPHTLGRKILEGEEYVNIHGRDYKVRAHVCRLEGTSGHADQQELLTWLGEVIEQGSVRGIALVHGELEASSELAKHIEERFHIQPIIPNKGDEWEIG